MNKYAVPLLRYSLVLLFLWFGAEQLMNPSPWVSYLPQFLGYFPIPGEMIVRMNGWFEIVFAALLAVGAYTRFVSAVLGTHLLGIAATAGGAIGMRDFTLGMSAFSLACGEADTLTLDRFIERRSLPSQNELLRSQGDSL